MTEVEAPQDLVNYVGKELGVSDWVTVSEDMILRFADISGDKHWIHTDPARAARETSFDGIIAHGYLTLSFATAMGSQCLHVRSAKRWLNSGTDRIRFLNVVKPASRLRGRFVLNEAKPQSDGSTRLVMTCTIEIEGESRPAMIADIVKVAFT